VHNMTTIPKTQKVILFEETSQDLSVLQYKDFPVPEISADEILIKNKYAGVNFIEAYFRSGLYPSKTPYVLGREASGVVVAKGDNVTKFKVGDKVAYLSPSTFAQYTKVDGTTGIRILKLKDDASEEDLKLFGSVLVQALTALTFVYEPYNVKSGDFILIHAAAGGVGQLLTQLAASKGAKVIATASTDAKLQIAKELGASFLINSSTEDIVEKVKEFTNGVGVNAVYDGIGKATFEASFESLAPKGTFVSFGNASGAVPPFSISRLAPKNIAILRPQLFGYTNTPETWEKYSKELLGLLSDGKLKFSITKVYSLKDYPKAAQELESRATTGKLTLEIPQ